MDNSQNQKKMDNNKLDLTELWNIAVFLQMIAAFDNEIDFIKYGELMSNFYELIKNYDKHSIKEKLPEYESKLLELFEKVQQKYPLKRDYNEIAKDWNKNFVTDKEFLSNGVMIGWLEKQIDLSNYYWYDYTPFHFKIGLVIHKNRGEIEENFLLQDSFTCLIKAKKALNLLNEYGDRQKKYLQTKRQDQFDKDSLDTLNFIKYEISFYSRQTVVLFYSFLECFVNSIGFDFYYRNIEHLNSDEIEILQGKSKGKYLNLKTKIEKFQKIIRTDKTAKIILTANAQIKEPFKTIFENYEELRNSTVHFSPSKSRIWLKPNDWVINATNFSKLVIDAAFEIWETCHETNKGPDYLGRLKYDRLYKIAQKRVDKIIEIKNDS